MNQKNMDEATSVWATVENHGAIKGGKMIEKIREEAMAEKEREMLATLSKSENVRIMVLRGTINLGTIVEDEVRNKVERVAERLRSAIGKLNEAIDEEDWRETASVLNDLEDILADEPNKEE